LKSPRRALLYSLILFFIVAIFARESSAQQPASEPSSTSIQGEAESDAQIKRLPLNLWEDQKRIWTSPVHLRASSLKWIMPLTFASAATFGSDQEIERKISGSSSISRATTFSNVGIVGFAGLAAGQYLWGMHTHNDKLKETGFLSGEAALDSFLLTELTKGIAQRERPTDGTGQGRFFKSSSPLGSSFVSQHSTVAFSMATVVAQEYPGVMTKIVAYGGASAIGAARIVGDKHFASDVLLGSALGYFIGRQVYNGHSQESKTDRLYGVFEKEKRPRDPSMMASSYVPLDSWIYPAMDRLIALGYITDLIAAQRPWTRKQVAEMVFDIDSDELPEQVKQSVETLQSEFQREQLLLEGASNVDAAIDNVYTRFGGISGQPLNDSMHFGQTIVDDFGRPYAEGYNQVTGVEAHSSVGPLVFYARGEYQHAPGTPALPDAANAAIAAHEQLPLRPNVPGQTINRLRFLDAYVGLNIDDWQLSFGKQSLWWGPGRGGDLMLSNNAEPLTMLRLSNVGTKRLPWLFRYLGPLQTTTFVGQMQGDHFLRLGTDFQLVGSWDTYVNPQPFLWGEHLSFKLTQNLEVGVSITTVFAGLGRPMTLSTFKHSLSSKGNDQTVEPGDRRTGFDFSYRIPGLRRWLTLYSGSMAEDEPNPIAYPRRSSMNPGIYLSHVPGLSRLDFRAESVYTDIPNLRGVGVSYTNFHYVGGYTNNGQILGSWVGPQGRGLEFKSTYWFSAQNKFSLGYRSHRVAPEYLGGGSLNDYTAQYTFKLPQSLEVNAALQYERWNFPLLSATSRSDVSSGVELRWTPKRLHISK
jgi:membrane-associated phospholipid phosphatase